MVNIGETGNSERKYTLNPELCVQAATPLPRHLLSAWCRSPVPCGAPALIPVKLGSKGPRVQEEQLPSHLRGVGQQQAVTGAKSRGHNTRMILHPKKSCTGIPLALGRWLSDYSSHLKREGWSRGTNSILGSFEIQGKELPSAHTFLKFGGMPAGGIECSACTQEEQPPAIPRPMDQHRTWWGTPARPLDPGSG